MNNYISVSQYAEIKGITKQAVYKQLNGKLKNFLIMVDNQKFIDINALNDIERKKLNNFEQPVQQPVEQPLNNEIQLFLQNQINEKDEQIKTLLNQIDQLQDQNTKLTDLLKNSQLLLAVEKKVMLEESAENQQEKKKGFLNIFKRKESV